MVWRVLPKSGKLRCPVDKSMLSVFYDDSTRECKQVCGKCNYTKSINGVGKVDGTD